MLLFDDYDGDGVFVVNDLLIPKMVVIIMIRMVATTMMLRRGNYWLMYNLYINNTIQKHQINKSKPQYEDGWIKTACFNDFDRIHPLKLSSWIHRCINNPLHVPTNLDCMLLLPDRKISHFLCAKQAEIFLCIY